MQDRQHSAIMYGIQELVRVTARGEGAGLGFSVANYTGHNKVWIIQCSPVCMQNRIPQFTTFVDRARSFWRHVAGNPIRPGKLPEESLHSVTILFDVWINLSVRPLKICVGHDSGTAVPGSDDVDHVEIVLHNQSV